MFYFKIGEKELKVLFKHEKKEVTHAPKEEGEEPVVQLHPCKTTCKIVDADSVISEAIAACDPRDHFEYAYGRKLSLKRALISAGFGVTERTIVWDAYFG